MKLQDMTDQGTISPDSAPWGLGFSTPNGGIQDFSGGHPKVTKNMKPEKAVGPDKLKSLLLQDLRDEIAPILQIIFQRSGGSRSWNTGGA